MNIAFMALYLIGGGITSYYTGKTYYSSGGVNMESEAGFLCMTGMLSAFLWPLAIAFGVVMIIARRIL